MVHLSVHGFPFTNSPMEMDFCLCIELFSYIDVLLSLYLVISYRDGLLSLYLVILLLKMGGFALYRLILPLSCAVFFISGYRCTDVLFSLYRVKVGQSCAVFFISAYCSTESSPDAPLMSLRPFALYLLFVSAHYPNLFQVMTSSLSLCPVFLPPLPFLWNTTKSDTGNRTQRFFVM